MRPARQAKRPLVAEQRKNLTFGGVYRVPKSEGRGAARRWFLARGAREKKMR